MRIYTLGCGNAGSFKNYNASFLLYEGDRVMLVDCGTRIPIALHDQDIDPKTIIDVYISHAHADHCGGLEELVFGVYDWLHMPAEYSDSPNPSYAPNLICNAGLLADLWKHTLFGGLNSMQGFVATLSTYFKPIPISANKTYEWCGWKCSLVQQVHIMAGSTIMSTFGLFMEKPGHKSVFFTTDAQHFQPEQVSVYYKKADLVFQDCECIGVNTTTKTMIYKSGVHANYAQLAGWESVNAYKIAADIKAKIYLTHYQDFVSENKDNFGNACDWQELARSDGFLGFVNVADTFEI